MMTQATERHVYTLVVEVPGGERTVYWSKHPFGAMHVGDEVSPWTYGSPRPDAHRIPRGENVTAYKIGRIVREVSKDPDEILDTTWIYLDDK